jgi:hypothetical protein
MKGACPDGKHGAPSFACAREVHPQALNPGTDELLIAIRTIVDVKIPDHKGDARPPGEPADDGTIMEMKATGKGLGDWALVEDYGSLGFSGAVPPFSTG